MEQKEILNECLCYIMCPEKTLGLILLLSMFLPSTVHDLYLKMSELVLLLVNDSKWMNESLLLSSWNCAVSFNQDFLSMC